MAHYDIFRHHLAIKYPAYGHALWEPSPGSRYPAVAVGDVGFIREGQFHRLFNVLLSPTDPSHRIGVPEENEQLRPRVEDHIITGTLSPIHFCSAGVALESEPEVFANDPKGSAGVSFSCRRKQGAVLSVPIQARCENTVALGDFGEWITKHIDRWFAWARELGMGINRMEDIVLVTGAHRTRSWINVAFLEGQTDSRVSFEAQVAADTSINWLVSPDRIIGAVLNHGPIGKDLPEDQCIFIRGFRVTRKLMILPRVLKGAAGPNPDPKGPDSKPDVELVPISTVPEYCDPLHILLEYIAESASDCDIVLVHDDDLARLDGFGDDTSLDSLRPGAVATHLRRSKPEIREVLFHQGSKDANADTKTVRVAMLSSSQTFEGRPTPPPPTSSGLIARTIALGTEIVRAVMLSGSQTFERQPTLPSPTSSRLVARTIAPSNSSPDRPESNSTLPHLHSHPTSMTNTQNEVHSWTSQGVCRPPGRLESNSTLPHLLSYPTSTANTQNEVLSWTSQDPRQSLLFSPWGIVYRFQTDTNAPGQLITILWRTIRSNKEDRVAKLEWAPNGGLGRATIGRTPLPMADLIRRDPQLPNSRVFTGPDGFQYRWRPSPNTNSQDIGLQDPNNNVIAFIRPTRPTRYQVGDVYAELHFVRSAGTGIVMHPPLMDMVTVTAMLYRFASAYNL